MTSKHNSGILCCFAILIMGLLFFLPANLSAGELEKMKIKAGLDLFPSLLAADSDIRIKKDQTGELQLLIIYENNKILADEMAIYLKRLKSVRGTNFNVITTNYSEIEQYKDTRIAGIFLVQKSSKGLENIINFSIAQKAIIFSPFKGDVEKGVSCGLIISDIMQPYLNMKTLDKASIRIKPFFLKVAELYEL